jgi:hypothetical protein
MDGAERPLKFAEGETLRGSIVAALNFLAEIEALAVQKTGKFAPLVSTYRAEMQPTIQRSIELFRLIEPLAPYVGGVRAEELHRTISTAVGAAGTLRDDPSETALEQLGRGLVDAVRSASDLIVLGGAVEESRRAAAAAAESVRQAAETNVGLRQKEVDTTASALRQEISDASERLRKELEGLLQELSARGNEVVAQSKKRIAGDILNDAQQQFSSAQRGLNIQVGVWSGVAVGCLVAFFWFAGCLLDTQLPEKWTWQIAFFAGVRIIILGGIGAVASFALRMVKAHIALAQVNAHRTRVARSMPSFLEVAPSDQRFTVLESLIGTIISTKESAINDSNAETVLTTVSVVEQAMKAKKSSE